MTIISTVLLPIALLCFISSSTHAFTVNTCTSSPYKTTRQVSNNGATKRPSLSSPRYMAMNDNNNQEQGNNRIVPTTLKSLAVAMALSINTMSVANAALDFDDSTETLNTVITSLKSAASNGDSSATLKEFENIAAIITEGKGVGGSISNTGVKLDRGFVADEDTAIYNPGLTLLTESEKERLVNAIMDSRKALVGSGAWNNDNQIGYDFLKEKLDPLHMTELKGYLGILPLYGAAVYLGAFAVQLVARDAFPIAYIISAFAVFAPIFVLLLFSS